MRKMVYIYHHIPKCGGASMQDVIGKIFDLKKNYRIDKDDFEFSKLTSSQCMVGHFDLPGNYLKDLYPEVFFDKKYRILSFIRDPLDIRLSLFRYEHKMGRCRFKTIFEDFATRQNWLSKRFPVTEENYRDVLDQYYFIGLLERKKESLDVFFRLIGVEPVELPHKNTTRKDFLSIDSLSNSDIDEFKRNNALDYLVYEYVEQKLDIEIKKPVL